MTNPPPDPITLARKIRIRRLGELEPYDRNARTHSAEQLEALASSIREFGFVQPILARESGQVVAGHARLEAARLAGLDRVPVIVLDHLTEDQARALVLADNRLAELGGWDAAHLAAALGDRGEESAALRLSWTDAELAALLEEDPSAPASKPAGPAPEDPEATDRLGELAAKWATNGGQVWRVPSASGDDHRLLIEDSLAAGTAATLLDGREVGAMVTDPPYAIYGSSSGLASDVTDDRIVRPFFEKVWRLAADVLPWHGHAYAFCDWRSWSAVWEGARVGGMAIKNLLVWDKGGAGLGANYANTHEFVAFAHRTPPQKAMGDRPAGVRVVGGSNVLRHNRVPSGARWHNAAKPVELLAELIANSTDEGAVVLDPFLGSASIVVAAEQTGRVAYGVEVDPLQAANALERLVADGFHPELEE